MAISNSGLSSLKIRFYVALFLFVLALAVRVLFFINTTYEEHLRGDALSYARYADNIINYQTFSRQSSEDPTPDSFWAPGYPLLLAGLTLVANATGSEPIFFVIYFQQVVSSLIAVLAFLLAIRFLPLGFSIVAALLVVVSPHMISYGTFILTEILFSFCVILSIYSALLFKENPSKRIAIISGLSFGVSYLVNPVFLFFPFAILLVWLNRFKSSRGLIFLVFGLYFSIVGSWATRNMVSVQDKGMTSSYRLYMNLIIGSYDSYHDIWMRNPRDPNNPADIDIRKFDGDTGGFLIDLSRRVKEDPLHYLIWYFVEKPINLWRWSIFVGFADVFVYPVYDSPYHHNIIADKSHMIMKYLHWWLWGAALIGLAFSLFFYRAAKPDEIILSLCLVYFSAVYAVTQADSRYSVPFRPEMYLMAVALIYRLYSVVVPYVSAKMLSRHRAA